MSRKVDYMMLDLFVNLMRCHGVTVKRQGRDKGGVFFFFCSNTQLMAMNQHCYKAEKQIGCNYRKKKIKREKEKINPHCDRSCSC